MRGWSSPSTYPGWHPVVFPAHAGVIPTWKKAGEVPHGISRTCGGDPPKFGNYLPKKVYFPHMRGWSYCRHLTIFFIFSISRTCGGDPDLLYCLSLTLWYFPHMRGWSRCTSSGFICCRVFPAHAGVILYADYGFEDIPGISRTCGGDPTCGVNFWSLTKYFPHMRGWSHGNRKNDCKLEVFPAHAGVIPDSRAPTCKSIRISRTCGGDPKFLQEQAEKDGYFPHMRGWSWWNLPEKSLKCVFPAHAGVILIQYHLIQSQQRISRTCGGDPSPAIWCASICRYFPHMRGWS